MSSATVSIFMLCRRQNSIRSGTRAMLPSSFMISHMIPAGTRPASRAGSSQIRGFGCRIDRNLNRAGAIVGRDPGRHALARVNRFTKGGTVLGSVLGGHRADIEMLQPLPGHGETNQASSVLHHEVDGLRSYFLGRKSQITFVLTVLVVDDHNHTTGADLLNRILNVCKWKLRAHKIAILAEMNGPVCLLLVIPDGDCVALSRQPLLGRSK